MMTLFLSTSLAIQAPAPSDFYTAQELVLSAIVEVESKGNRHAQGTKGERGLYQFTKRTWEFYTRQSFDLAYDATVSTRVAIKHYNWIVAEFLKYKKSPTHDDIYIVWNTGFDYYKRRSFNPSKINKQAKQNLVKFQHAYVKRYQRN